MQDFNKWIVRWRVILPGLLGAWLVACGGTTPQAPTTQTRVPLGQCLLEGGGLSQGWQVDNGHGAIQDMVAGPDGTIVLAGDNGVIKRWNATTKAQTWSDQLPIDHLGGIYGVQVKEPVKVSRMLLQGETLIAGNIDGHTRALNLSGGPGIVPIAQLSSTAEISPEIMAIIPLADGKLLLANGAYTGEPVVWDPQAGEASPIGDTDWWNALWFVRDGRLIPDAAENQVLMAGNWYGVPSVGLVSTDKLEQLSGRWIMDHRGGDLVDLDVTADGTFAAAGTVKREAGTDENGVMQFEDVGLLVIGNAHALGGEAAKPEHVLELAQTTQLVDVVIAGPSAIAVDGEGAMFVIDLASGALVKTLSTPNVTRLATTGEGHVLATGGSEGKLTLWECQ